MANNDDFGLIFLFGSLDIDGLHIGSVCLGSKFFVVTSFLGCMKWYGGTDEINFEVNCRTRYSIVYLPYATINSIENTQEVGRYLSC